VCARAQKEWKVFVIVGLLHSRILLKRTANRKAATLLGKKGTRFCETIYLDFKLQSYASFAG
jgi:hypothetical protein